MRPRPSSPALPALVAVLLAGCTTTTTIVGGVDAPLPEITECQTDAYAFFGETSLAAIGLAGTVGGPDVNRVGTVWVTAGPVAWDVGPGPGAGPGLSPGRVVCVEWPDGSGMATMVDDAWQPPGGGDLDVVRSEAPAWPIIAAIAVLVLVLGGSYLAFRRE